ncbi:MAG: carboxymuconolactone decarboxylase family protein [Rhodanobacter sp.]|nr:MAG: carboxymuconolactone decarboxylase family protein [Rhodanobacter sp.]TAM14038.1 MAG: carboxymuconolactone decarboxylase family protein [Rhodanobacter sp.]TAM37028.1 MAG: carboxymuconolactone decarboxylase family protein [Rhodanobacter sp.]
MTKFTTHTLESAPAAARPLLEAAKSKLGFIPNLYGNLAEAPAALQAYFDLSAHFDKTSFTPVERQVVLLAISTENNCEFCVAAHSVIARQMVKVPSPVVDALRAFTPLPDAHLDALATFARAVVRERGFVASAALDAFLASGFTRRQVIEVVLGVSMKTLSNYVNHLTGTVTNSEFATETWKRAA